MREGQRAVWRQLPAIQAACAIEMCLDDQLRAVTLAVRAQTALHKAAVQVGRATSGAAAAAAPLELPFCCSVA